MAHTCRKRESMWKMTNICELKYVGKEMNMWEILGNGLDMCDMTYIFVKWLKHLGNYLVV